ncbi:MAG: hypothetical protein WAN20_03525 [Pseudonocardiaceae bacterium]
MHLDSHPLTLHRHPAADPVSPAPGRGVGIPSLRDDMADVLALGAMVAEFDPDVRDAMATVAAWLRSGRAGSESIAGLLALTEHNATAQAPEWGRSPTDRQFHAVDAWAEHPYGVWVAPCGHTLPRATPLSAELGDWRPCRTCVRWSAR